MERDGALFEELHHERPRDVQQICRLLSRQLIPQSLYAVLLQAVKELMRGRAVSIMPVTAQELGIYDE